MKKLFIFISLLFVCASVFAKPKRVPQEEWSKYVDEDAPVYDMYICESIEDCEFASKTPFENWELISQKKEKHPNFYLVTYMYVGKLGVNIQVWNNGYYLQYYHIF